MAPIASVGEAAPRDADSSAIESHTRPWSDRRLPPSRIECRTLSSFSARPRALWTRSLTSKWGVRYDHRPASTHDTGMIVVRSAGISMVRLATRFCLAPTSSSPSTISTGRSARFSTLSSGTLPPSDTSRMVTSPFLSPSSSRR